MSVYQTTTTTTTTILPPFVWDYLDESKPEGLTILDFAEAEMMGWQWHQLNHMQVNCISLQTYNHASTSSLNFLWTGCSSCCPTNSIKALKVKTKSYCNKNTTTGMY